MPRPPRPWYWKAKKAYYVTVNGQRHRLSKDKKEATELFYRMMADPQTTVVRRRGSFAELVEHFMDWTKANRKPRTYDWYKERIKRFLDSNPLLELSGLKAHHVQQWLDSQTWGNTYKRGCVRRARAKPCC